MFCRIFCVCMRSDAFIKSQQKQSAGVNFGQAGRGRGGGVVAGTGSTYSRCFPPLDTKLSLPFLAWAHFNRAVENQRRKVKEEDERQAGEGAGAGVGRGRRCSNNDSYSCIRLLGSSLQFECRAEHNNSSRGLPSSSSSSSSSSPSSLSADLTFPFVNY